jgi:hypothetical protein
MGIIMKFNSRRFCQLLLVLCGAVILLLVILYAGIVATPYETADSAGRTMGFNDRLSLEHYGIIIRNFKPSLLFRSDYLYDQILFASYAIGLVLIFSHRFSGLRSTRWFFAIQGLLFPFAWAGLLAFPIILFSVFTGQMDREGFIDIPFLWVTAHTVWLTTSLLIAWRMPGEPLGFRATSNKLISFVASRIP